MTDCIRREDIGLTDFEIILCQADENKYKSALVMLLEKIEKLPAADVRPVVHGEWKHKVTSSYAGGGATFCSVCGYGYSDGAFFEVEDFDYCPHCGATMKVDRRDIELL